MHKTRYLAQPGLTLGMHVAQRSRAHVAHLDGALAAAVHEHVAVPRMELRAGDHLRSDKSKRVTRAMARSSR